MKKKITFLIVGLIILVIILAFVVLLIKNNATQTTTTQIVKTTTETTTTTTTTTTNETKPQIKQLTFEEATAIKIKLLVQTVYSKKGIDGKFYLTENGETYMLSKTTDGELICVKDEIYLYDNGWKQLDRSFNNGKSISFDEVKAGLGDISKISATVYNSITSKEIPEFVEFFKTNIEKLGQYDTFTNYTLLYFNSTNKMLAIINQLDRPSTIVVSLDGQSFHLTTMNVDEYRTILKSIGKLIQLKSFADEEVQEAPIAQYTGPRFTSP